MSENDDTRARRMFSVNEALIQIMSERIKVEVGKLIDAGASTDQINESLQHIIFFWDHWREDMLQQIVATFDDEAERAHAASDIVALRPRTN